MSEINLSGFTFTAQEWSALDDESRELLAGDEEYAAYEVWIWIEPTPPLS